ncbi:hypothetical protein TNCV_1349501 [Trichonephila clavipes]|nr:hypothetical protein TNCV_1349501 [Trichonephila clavipes]
MWASTNPYRTQPSAAQLRFSANIWAGILRDYLIGPYLQSSPLDGRVYLTFLQQVLPELLDAALFPVVTPLYVVRS